MQLYTLRGDMKKLVWCCGGVIICGCVEGGGKTHVRVFFYNFIYVLDEMTA